MATNISHWLKVQSRGIKNYIFAKKCILISFWIFKYCFYYSFTHYNCTIFYSLDAGFFQYHQGVKQFGSRSGLTFCWPLSGSILFAFRLSADTAGKELNTKQLVDTFWLKPWLKLISFGSNFSIWLKCWLQQILSQGKPWISTNGSTPNERVAYHLVLLMQAFLLSSVSE